MCILTTDSLFKKLCLLEKQKRILNFLSSPYNIEKLQLYRFYRFEETSVNYAVCNTNDTRCLGGFARLFQEIKTLLRDYPDALLLNAGDAFQGTYWYTLFKWNITQHFINMLPNDVHVSRYRYTRILYTSNANTLSASSSLETVSDQLIEIFRMLIIYLVLQALGNHEFDDSIEGLVPYLQALHAPIVAANLDSSKEPSLNGLYQPHVVVTRNGRRIGIIGLITTETMVS